MRCVRWQVRLEWSIIAELHWYVVDELVVKTLMHAYLGILDLTSARMAVFQSASAFAMTIQLDLVFIQARSEEHDVAS